MSHRSRIAIAALACVAVLAVAAVSMRGQPPASPAKSTSAKAPATSNAGNLPRLPWGDPDLQGTWFVLYDVPLERSAANAGKEFLSDAEVEAADAKKGLNPGRNARSSNAEQDVSGAYNAVFNSVLRTGKRTSMIIDPPDGKIPPIVPGSPAAKFGQGFRLGLGTDPGVNDNPETIPQSPRCLGVPMPFLPLNTLFAQGTVMQIVQSPKTMGIYMEDDHAGGGNRIIFMDGRPHAPARAKFYLGDSRGHWEGNTLVVETTNYLQGFRGSDPDTYKTIEHFTRVDAHTLRRNVTFIDPKTWTKPWTVTIDMGRGPDGKHMIFDSACHEGNEGIIGILYGNLKEEQGQSQKQLQKK